MVSVTGPATHTVDIVQIKHRHSSKSDIQSLVI